MGYYASCSGEIFIRPGVYVNRIEQALKSTWFDFCKCETKLNDVPVVDFDICADEKYHEEDVWSVLKLMEPYTVKGSLNYCGEDGCFWRFKFKDNRFVEEGATMFYDEDIENIKRRAVKERITDETVKKAEQVLIDNGIGPDEADTVLQAICYALLDEELYQD